jgi:hypothetical protein
MLVRIKNNSSVDAISTQARDEHFRQWMRQLPAYRFDQICDALNEYIEHQGNGEIVTSSWIPGSDWNRTPYLPIYEAVGEDEDLARLFFGLIVWRVMMDRPETWAFGRYPRKEGDVIGLTYFKAQLN